MNILIEKAEKVFLENFGRETCFERAVFFSWYCRVADCKFCYMSTQPKEVIEKKKFARRSTESILAEFILCKKFGWDIGFFSGGKDAFNFDEFKELLHLINIVTKENIWINIGALKEGKIQSFKPYIKGVVGSVETINPKVHALVCPSKPIEPIEDMFKLADKHGLKKAVTIILGLGESIDDFSLLVDFIKKTKIDKIHFYGLNPHKGTMFENSSPPSTEYQSEWIARTRIEFPGIDIQCGIWADRTDRVANLLKAGSNSVSKFPVIRYFGKKEAALIEDGAKKAGRIFRGTLTKLLDLDLENEVKNIAIGNDLKAKVRDKLDIYVRAMKKNSGK